jgi:hypothetical protein
MAEVYSASVFALLKLVMPKNTDGANANEANHQNARFSSKLTLDDFKLFIKRGILTDIRFTMPAT